MGEDLRARSGEEPVRVCGTSYGVLKLVDFLLGFPPECVSELVHKRSPQAPIWATWDSKSLQRAWGGQGLRERRAWRCQDSPGGFPPKLALFALAESPSGSARLTFNGCLVPSARGKKSSWQRSCERGMWSSAVGLKIKPNCGIQFSLSDFS